MAIRLTFHGGAESVTGSNFLIESEEGGKLLVDCGLEQGADFCESCMYEPFPYDASTIDALVITHAHLDHVGRVPKLFKEGFTGKIYMTEATRDLAELIMRDSVGILGQEASSRGVPPLYDESHVDMALEHYEALSYHTEKEVAPGLSVYLRNTGHILGSASVRIKATDGTALAITSDLGNSPSPLLPNAEPITDADVVVLESVYGDRAHDPQDRVKQLKDSLTRAIERGGAILIPAFSIERTQLMLYEISNMMESGELPKIPVFLDSPLAIKVTDVYEARDTEYFKKGVQEELRKEGSIFSFPMLTKTESREDSENIDSVPNPKIIIAGAGMSHGGRIGKHEIKYLPDPTTTLFIVGYQAPGSPGRMLQDGAPKVKINNREVKVRAKVETFGGWSAHADRDGLVEFAQESAKRAHSFLIALGEPSSARFLAQRIHDFVGKKAVVPTKGEVWEITKTEVKKITHA